MMPSLMPYGKYTLTVLSAYGISALLLSLTWWRSHQRWLVLQRHKKNAHEQST